MDKFAAFMQRIAVPAYFIVGAITFFGGIQVTGARPGGVLSNFGLLGGIAAVIVATVYGWLAPIFLVLEWFSVIAIPAAIVGTMRRRARWYAIPFAIALALVSHYGAILATSVVDWLGGVSRFDVASYWAMSAAILLTGIGLFPGWVRGFWRWTNGAKVVPTESIPLT